MNCIKLFIVAGLLSTTAAMFAQQSPVNHPPLPDVSWGKIPITPPTVTLGQKYTFTYYVKNNSNTYVMHAVPKVSQSRRGPSTVTVGGINTCLRGIQPQNTCEFTVTISPKKEDVPIFNAALTVTFPGSSYAALPTISISAPVVS